MYYGAYGVPDIPVEDVAVCIDEVVVVLQPEVFEDLVHGLRHAAVKLWALDWLVRANLLVVPSVLRRYIRNGNKIDN